MRKLAVLLLGAACAYDVLACAPAPHAGDQIAIVEESAAIVWEPATRTQHFIRRATFRGKGRDFGFLVPTPTEPALAEVDSRIFDDLEARTRRERVYVTTRKVDWTPLLLWWRLKEGANRDVAAVGAGVNVLSTQKIAGYEAAVLDASDANALNDWLATNGYATTPDLAEWLAHYVQKQWKITAFKIDPERDEVAASTSAVKMSFTTDRPFFPYREPRVADTTFHTNRILRVWYLGPERVGGTVGESTFWPAVLKRSDALPEPLRNTIASLSGVALPASLRLTAFEDYSTLRDGNDDLYFARSKDQSEYVEPPLVIETVKKTPVPLDVVLAAGIVLVLVVRRGRRKARGPNIDAPPPVH